MARAPLAVAVLLVASLACVVGGPHFAATRSMPWGGTASTSFTAAAAAPSGLVWAAGETTSTDFPLGGAAASHMQAAHGGGARDCVLVAWDAAAHAVVAATYVGWEGDEWNCRVAMGDDGMLWLAATTTSTMRNSTDGSQPEGGDTDVVVVGMHWTDATSTLVLVEVFYVGGAARDELAALRVDGDGVLHVVGTVRDNIDTPAANASLRFPAQTNDLNAPGTVQSGADGFYVQLAETGEVLFAALVGGDGDDALHDVTWSDDGAALLLCGRTASSALLGTPRAAGAAHADGLLVRLESTGMSVEDVALFGGSADDALTHVHVARTEESNTAVVVAAGWTRSNDSAASGALVGAQDAVVAMWPLADLQALVSAQLLGGVGDADGATALAGASAAEATMWLALRTPTGGAAAGELAPLGTTVEDVDGLTTATAATDAYVMQFALLDAALEQRVGGAVSGGAAHALLPTTGDATLAVVGTTAPRGAVPVGPGGNAPDTLSGAGGTEFGFVQMWTRALVACNGNDVCEADEDCLCGDCAASPACAAPGHPGVPTRTGGGLTSIDVAWTAPAAPTSAVASYLVAWGVHVPSGTTVLDQTQRVNAPATSLSVTGLDEDTAYVFQVQARGLFGADSVWSESGILRTDAPCVPDCTLCVPDDGCGSPCLTGACTLMTEVCHIGACVLMPPTPADVQEGSVVGLSTIELVWAAPTLGAGEAAIDYYLVEWGEGAGGTTFPSSQQVNHPATSLLLEGLQSATVYRFRVRAVNVDGVEGVPAAVVEIATVDPNACVPRCTQCGADDGCGTPCATGSCVHLGLLFTCNSAEARCEGPPQPPHAPTVVRTMPTRVWLEWNDPIDNFAAITHYIVERQHVNAGDAYTTVHTTTGPVREYMDGGLIASHQYAYRMRAVNSRGSSGVGGSSPVHLPSPMEPDAVDELVLVSQSLTSVYFEWTPPIDNGATLLGYRVYAQRLPDLVVEPPVPGTELVLAAERSRPYYNAFGLDTGFEFRFVVESFNVIGVSNRTEAIFETLGTEARRDSADALGEEDIQALAFGLGGGSLLLSVFFAAYHWRRKSLKKRRDLQWGEREAHNPWEAKYDVKHENVDSRGYWFMAWAFLFLALCGFVTGALWKDVLEEDPSAE